MQSVEIIYAAPEYIESFHRALDVVAREQIYIEMIEAPPLEKVRNFQLELIEKNGPVYYAIKDDQVIGWCDIFPFTNPRQNHRGGLGMGLLPEFRGQGIGSQLLEKVISHAREFELEKIELYVYSDNEGAIRLYEKFGFVKEGLVEKYRKLNHKYFDCVMMAKWLNP